MKQKKSKLFPYEMFDIVAEILDDDFLKYIYDYQNTEDPDYLMMAIKSLSEPFGSVQKAVLDIIKNPLKIASNTGVDQLFTMAVEKHLQFIDSGEVKECRDSIYLLMVYLHRIKQEISDNESHIDEDEYTDSSKEEKPSGLPSSSASESDPKSVDAPRRDDAEDNPLDSKEGEDEDAPFDLYQTNISKTHNDEISADESDDIASGVLIEDEDGEDQTDVEDPMAVFDADDDFFN